MAHLHSHGNIFEGMGLGNTFEFDNFFFSGIEPSSIDFDIHDILKDFVASSPTSSSSQVSDAGPTAFVQPSHSIPQPIYLAQQPQPSDFIIAKEGKATRGGSRGAAAQNPHKRTRIRVREVDKIRALEAVYQEKLREYQTLAEKNAILTYKKKTLESLVGLRNFHVDIMVEDFGKMGIQVPNTADVKEAVVDDLDLAAEPEQLSVTDLKPGCISRRWLLSHPDPYRRQLSPGEFADLWRQFLSSCSMYVIQMQHQSLNPFLTSKLADTVAPVICMCRNTSLLYPAVMETVLRTPLDPGASPTPAPDHWHMVLRTLDLANDQRCQLMSAYEVFTAIMNKALAERDDLRKQVEEQSQAMSSAHPPEAFMQFPPEAELLVKVERNLQAVFSAHLLLRGFLMASVLNLKQFVHLCVYSFPYFPDCTAIIEALCAGTTPLTQDRPPTQTCSPAGTPSQDASPPPASLSPHSN